MVKTTVAASFASIDFNVPPQVQSGAALDNITGAGTAVGAAVGGGGGFVGTTTAVGTTGLGVAVAGGWHALITIETTMSTAISAHILRLCDMFFLLLEKVVRKFDRLTKWVTNQKYVRKSPPIYDRILM
jgi:hypothetical protein